MSALFIFSIISTLLINQPTIEPTYSSIQVFDAIPRNHNRLINFSAGAGYWTYYLGIARFIQENYNLDNIDFVGTSAGSFVSAALAYRIPIDTIFMKFGLEHLDRCSKSILGVFGYWNISYSQVILDGCREFNFTPSRNRNYIGVSRLTRTGFRKLYFDGGLSYETTATALITSCWIPFITAPFIQPLVRIGNYFYGDGVWTGKDKAKHEKQLIIYPNRLERLPLSTYWLWLGRDYNIQLYKLGYDHAVKHRRIFDEFFA